MLGTDVYIWPEKKKKNNRKENVIFGRKCKIQRRENISEKKKETVLKICKENIGNLFPKTEVEEINKKHKIIRSSKIWR